MHKYAAVPSSYHQCLKGIWAGKKVNIPATERPFEACEAHLADAVYFSEIEEACEAITAKPQGVKIPKWENIKDEVPTLAGPRHERSEASGTKRTPVIYDLPSPRKVNRTSEGGRTIYTL